MAPTKEYHRLKARMDKLSENADRLKAKYEATGVAFSSAADIFLDYCDRTKRNEDTGQKLTPEEIERQKEIKRMAAEIFRDTTPKGQK